MSSAMTEPLRWRIPGAVAGPSLRLGMAQIGLATVVCALILLVAAPREWLGVALMGLAPVAIFAAYRKWLRHQQLGAGPDNVWIDEAGLHWLDSAGQPQRFARGEIQGFRIARDEDTLRPVPALTLTLAGGFESQPIELHPPATPDEVRRVLAESWSLAEQSAEESTPGELSYDQAIDVYSECHDDFQEWHFEGTRAALNELFSAIAAAGQMPLAPLGARPKPRILLARRRHSSTLRLAHIATADCGDDRLGGPAEWLSDLGRRGQEAIASLASGDDGKFDLSLGPQNTWTFHLHVREP